MRIRATISMALAVGALASIGCGGSGSSGESSDRGQASTTQTLASTAAHASPAAQAAGSSAKRKATAKRPARHRSNGSGEAGVAAGSASSTYSPGQKSAAPRSKTGAGSSTRARHGSGQGREQGTAFAGNGKGQKKKGHKGLPFVPPPPPVAGNIPLPPGISVFDVAKNMCADPSVLQFLPEDQRDNPEALATIAKDYAPPGHEQEAHDGCLAGLKSQGIE
jgi:hypothetical protein